MTVLVSACLLGLDCKYNGGNNLTEAVREYLRDKVTVAVCPEVMGGLPVPRVPCEIRDGHVVSRDGKDMDEAFSRGADRIMEAIAHTEIDLAILKDRSPSCGCGKIYDGTFTGTLTDGNGVFAERLQKAGIPIVTENEIGTWIRGEQVGENI